MSYQVLARKWRPQTFDDVVGQDHVVQTLKNAIESGRVAHAYLFVGPRGTGKTSLARILSKALNWEKGPSITFDQDSDICREITAGNSLDVIEIDGASNNGVEQIRDLRESVGYAPARARHKIYIIDEVHMLTIAAFNALLKTLEEPPAHVKFMFATTEPQKVPATILSRCQRFDLRRISSGEIMKKLGEIAQAEKVTIDEKALFAIARGAEGGLRDAESALDQLIAFRGDQIKEEDVLAVFGLVAWAFLEDLAGSILKGDFKRIIEIVSDLDTQGKDMHRLLIELMEYYRNLLVFVIVGSESTLKDLTQVQIDKLSEQKKIASPERILEIVEILTETETQFRYALSKRTLFEMGLIRCARAAVVVTIDEIIKEINELKAGGTVSAPTNQNTVTASKPTPAPLNVISKPPRTAPEPTVSTRTVSESPAPDYTPAGGNTELLAAKWDEIIDHVGQLAPLAKNYLVDASPAQVVDDLVKIAFDSAFADNVEKINFPRNIKAIEKALEIVLKKPVTVEFTVVDTPALPSQDKKIAPGKPEEQNEPEPDTAGEGKPSRSKQEWLKEPAVQKTLEMFNGDIADIRD